MTDFNERINSIVIKNLPLDFNTNQLEELFSKYGKILSSRIVPHNPGLDGLCAFINYGDSESCSQAVKHMNQYKIGEFILNISRSTSRSTNHNFDRTQNVAESNFRSISITSINSDDTNVRSLHNIPESGFNPIQSNAERSQSVTQIKNISFNRSSSNTSENDSSSNKNKSILNNSNGQLLNNKSPLQNDLSNNIKEHEDFLINKTYNIYLSNIEVPNKIFVATLNDYANATLLITQMNKQKEASKIEAKSFKSNNKLYIGQACAALFNKDWYRARILEIGESRVRVQFIDWGNTRWCDSTLEIRSLSNEYYKEAALCVKCILDGVSSTEELSDEQTDAIRKILVLDVKIEMCVLRFENNIPYVQLNLNGRNLNNEICQILSPSISMTKQHPLMNFNSNNINLQLSDIHCVQLTADDKEPESFHVLMLCDSFRIVTNELKDWDPKKQPLNGQPKVNTLVCAKYEADDLWYRAWIKNINEYGHCVYFVDFGNEEIVSIDYLSECPEILKNIPWLSAKVKLANIKLADDERRKLFTEFDCTQLEMKIIQKIQDLYLVDLSSNGKSLVEFILEYRKKNQKQTPKTPITIETPKSPLIKLTSPAPLTNMETNSRISYENSRSLSMPIPPINEQMSRSTIVPTNSDTQQLLNSSKAVVKQTSTTEQNNLNTLNENLSALVAGQNQQNRLLEQILAAINTSNALLNQLVRR